MTRRQEIIVELLENYQHVVESWKDWLASGDHGFPMLNPVYNHPSYKELDRQLVALREAEPVIYWDVAQRFLYGDMRVVYRCPRCGPKPESLAAGLPHHKDHPQPPFGVDIDHKHSGKLFPLRPTRVRNCHALRVENLEAGIAWLDDHWQGEPFVPDFEARAA